MGELGLRVVSVNLFTCNKCRVNHICCFHRKGINENLMMKNLEMVGTLINISVTLHSVLVQEVSKVINRFFHILIRHNLSTRESLILRNNSCFLNDQIEPLKIIW